MNFKQICELIELVAKKGIPLVEVEQAGVRVKVQGTNGTVESMITQAPQQVAVKISAAEPSEIEIDPSHHIITSPMVGTFYSAPKPGADPFVKTGSTVDEGSILCIIEAMKLMNEIESDVRGEIVTIFPKNGEPIEFGQKLFALKTT